MGPVTRSTKQPGQLDSNGTQVKTSVKDFWKDNCDCVAGATAGIDVDHLWDDNIWKNRKKDPFKGWNDNANKCFLEPNLKGRLKGDFYKCIKGKFPTKVI